MILDYSYYRCDCYEDELNEIILRAVFNDDLKFEIEAQGYYSNFRLFSRPCFEHNLSGGGLNTYAPCPIEEDMCCKIEYNAYYVP